MSLQNVDQELIDILLFCMQQICGVLDKERTKRGAVPPDVLEGRPWQHYRQHGLWIQ